MIVSFSTEMFGRPNYFIEKIWTGLDPMISPDYYYYNEQYVKKFGEHWDGAWTDTEETCFIPKLHTLRTETYSRFSAGKLIHPGIHSRSPNYFQFAPALKIVSTQKVAILHFNDKVKGIKIDGRSLKAPEIKQFVINDGFESKADFFKFFPRTTYKIMIHWTDLRY